MALRDLTWGFAVSCDCAEMGVDYNTSGSLTRVGNVVV